MDSRLIEGALEWAAAGVPVFPCDENKRPLTEHGLKDAVTDPDKVRDLFNSYGDAAVMVGARMGKEAGIFALDFDLYKEKEAKSFMDNLSDNGLLPETRVHKTISGGVHVFYKSDKFWPNLNPVDGVEVKGEGGYVIIPPSPGYEVLHEGLIEAPVELVTALLARKKAMGDDTVDGLKQKILTGDNFHDSMARLAARRSGAGWPQEKVQAELLETLRASVAANPEHPRHRRWEKIMANNESEVTRIIGTGHSKYNSLAVREEFQQSNVVNLGKLRLVAQKAGFAPPPNAGKELEVVKPPESYGDDWPFHGDGYFASHDHDLLAQRYIMYPLFCEGESVLIAAEPKTGKTALALTAGLHVACGWDLGPSLRVAEPRGVLYFALEGRRAIRLRIAAWRRTLSELGKTAPDHIPLFVVERSKNLLSEVERINIANQIKAAELNMEKIYGVKLGLIFFDTLTKAMPGGNQNSTEDTSAVFDIVAKLRDLGCEAAVGFIHHKSKAGGIRGSSNIEADPDVLSTVSKAGKNIKWTLNAARSVEDGMSYTFRLHNYHLGKSGQGFDINAPVVRAVDDVPATVESFDEVKITNAAMHELLKLGDGDHPLKFVYRAMLNAELAPVSPSGKVTLRADNPVVQDWITALIPETGYVFAGKMVELVRENGKVTMVSIR